MARRDRHLPGSARRPPAPRPAGVGRRDLVAGAGAITGIPLARKRAALSAYGTAGTVLRLEAIAGLNGYRALGMPTWFEAAEAFAVGPATGRSRTGVS